jgi:hypothetical protein
VCRVVHDEGARAGVRVEERRENSTWLARTGELNLAYVAGFWQGLHVRSCGGQRVWRVVASAAAGGGRASWLLVPCR